MEIAGERFLEFFGDVATLRCVPRKTVLLEEGSVADTLYFVKSGCLRMFFYDEGKDVTFQFFFEGDVVASFYSMHTLQPSEYSLESIEPTELYAIGRDDFYRLVNRDVEAMRIHVEQLISRFHAYQQLFLSRIKNSPQQRYEELLREHPDILKRVPQHYIASYLGITAVSLSRIRGRH